MPERNLRILLAAHPVGEPKDSDFRIVEEPLPAAGPGARACPRGSRGGTRPHPTRAAKGAILN
jgi:hypothetical protein